MRWQARRSERYPCVSVPVSRNSAVSSAADLSAGPTAPPSRPMTGPRFRLARGVSLERTPCDASARPSGHSVVPGGPPVPRLFPHADPPDRPPRRCIPMAQRPTGPRPAADCKGLAGRYPDTAHFFRRARKLVMSGKAGTECGPRSGHREVFVTDAGLPDEIRGGFRLPPTCGGSNRARRPATGHRVPRGCGRSLPQFVRRPAAGERFVRRTVSVPHADPELLDPLRQTLVIAHGRPFESEMQNREAAYPRRQRTTGLRRPDGAGPQPVKERCPHIIGLPQRPAPLFGCRPGPFRASGRMRIRRPSHSLPSRP